LGSRGGGGGGGRPQCSVGYVATCVIYEPEADEHTKFCASRERRLLTEHQLSLHVGLPFRVLKPRQDGTVLCSVGQESQPMSESSVCNCFVSRANSHELVCGGTAIVYHIYANRTVDPI